MRELYDLTATQAIGYLVDDVVEAKGISRALAKKLVINALIYNTVSEEVFSQVCFLMGEDTSAQEDF